ncbi:hypothetical protein DFH27DRAFT_626126 [Peziza echinospora]|nr:hypothetical protein DFH27DRAFT_626126 [Peziza echinospora]
MIPYALVKPEGSVMGSATFEAGIPYMDVGTKQNESNLPKSVRSGLPRELGIKLKSPCQLLEPLRSPCSGTRCKELLRVSQNRQGLLIPSSRGKSSNIEVLTRTLHAREISEEGLFERPCSGDGLANSSTLTMLLLHLPLIDKELMQFSSAARPFFWKITLAGVSYTMEGLDTECSAETETRRHQVDSKEAKNATIDTGYPPPPTASQALSASCIRLYSTTSGDKLAERLLCTKESTATAESIPWPIILTKLTSSLCLVTEISRPCTSALHHVLVEHSTRTHNAHHTAHIIQQHTDSVPVGACGQQPPPGRVETTSVLANPTPPQPPPTSLEILKRRIPASITRLPPKPTSVLGQFSFFFEKSSQTDPDSGPTRLKPARPQAMRELLPAPSAPLHTSRGAPVETALAPRPSLPDIKQAATGASKGGAASVGRPSPARPHDLQQQQQQHHHQHSHSRTPPNSQRPQHSQPTRTSQPRLQHPQHTPPPPQCEHVVQFYDSDGFLYDTVTSFLLTTFFSAQEAAVVVATSAHIAALEHQLFHQHCLFPEVMKRRGQLVTFDADSVLLDLLAGGLTQATFDAFMAPVVKALRGKGYGKVLVYGELVDLLCAQGRHWDALELERIWNVFLAARAGDVELLCGYRLDVFALDESELLPGAAGPPSAAAEMQAAAFREICRTHSAVRPTEKAGGAAAARLAMYAGPASAAELPRALPPPPPRLPPPSAVPPSAASEQSLAIAVLEHRVRMLEKAAARAQERERELQRVLERLPVGICAVYTRGAAPRRAAAALSSTALTNGAFAATVGLNSVPASANRTPTDVARDWVEQAVHPEDRARVLESIGSTSASGAPTTCTYRVVQAGGEPKWVLGETVGAGTGPGAPETGYVHVVTDLTKAMGALRFLEAKPPARTNSHKRRAAEEPRHSPPASHPHYNHLDGNLHKHHQMQPHAAPSRAEPGAPASAGAAADAAARAEATDRNKPY